MATPHMDMEMDVNMHMSMHRHTDIEKAKGEEAGEKRAAATDGN